MRIKPWLIMAAIAAAPIVSVAQHQNDKDRRQDNHPAKHHPPPPPPSPLEAGVDFGVLPFPATKPLGPPPCAQGPTGIGGPGDPCAYKIHHLTPEETTIRKGGEVTFQFHGGGHGIAIYKVSRNTTRDEIGQYLCAGMDPSEIEDVTLHTCTGAAGVANANAAHVINDGKGDVVIVAEPNLTNAHPQNRVWSVPGRRMSAGGRQFLNGGAIPAGPDSDGQLVTYQFRTAGRYLIICMNRSHFLNDWMFGFVNVSTH